jgi:hypothetical protein
MTTTNPTSVACCFNSLSDCVFSINKNWIERWGEHTPGFCFRGADKFNYDLNPSLLRDPYPVSPELLANLENELWVEFRLRSTPLLGRHVYNAWEALLIMQQYGFPTRLLDWSRSLAVAAYFAVRNIDEDDDGAVWVMAARHLMEIRNQSNVWRTAVGDPQLEKMSVRVGTDGLDEFLSQTPVALSPDQVVPRMIVQRGIYTLHSFQRDSLISLAKKDEKRFDQAKFLHKIIIPAHAKEALRSELLLVAGVSEETIFPDLEGFARDFVSEFKRKRSVKQNC